MKVDKYPNQGEFHEQDRQMESIVCDLNQTLHEIDQTLTVSTPDISFFKQLTEETNRQANLA